MDAVFFVVDSADKDRITIAKEIMFEMGRHPGLMSRQIPFVVLANKRDAAGAIAKDEIYKVL